MCLAASRRDLIADDHGDQHPEEQSRDDQRGREGPNGADRDANERTRKLRAADRPGHPQPQQDVGVQVGVRVACEEGAVLGLSQLVLGGRRDQVEVEPAERRRGEEREPERNDLAVVSLSWAVVAAVITIVSPSAMMMKS